MRRFGYRFGTHFGFALFLFVIFHDIVCFTLSPLNWDKLASRLPVCIISITWHIRCRGTGAICTCAVTGAKIRSGDSTSAAIASLQQLHRRARHRSELMSVCAVVHHRRERWVQRYRVVQDGFSNPKFYQDVNLFEPCQRVQCCLPLKTN